MARVVVLGAGISGHTASAHLKRLLGRKHEVVVISPSKYYQWIPSNIWVGIGKMTSKQVQFELNKVYKRWGIDFRQAKAVSLHPEGGQQGDAPYVTYTYTSPDRNGETETVTYDYLVNATGPKLRFDKTEGLGPEGHTLSVCSTSHAVETWEELEKRFDLMKQGKKQRFLIGTGHAMATCQGAAFEYALNVAFEIQKRGLTDMSEITWITNEYEIGDFGMGGAYVKRGGYVTPTKVFTESVLSEYNIKWIKRAGVYKVEQGVAHYETLDGSKESIEFDFSMLIPAFTGQGITAYGKDNEEITDTIFAPNGFMKVDADYSPNDFEDWDIKDWPQTYQNPTYSNMYATGIAFAPPHSISKPMKSVNGTPIFPAPPRTGMPSGVIGKIVAQNIAAFVKKGATEHKHKANMGKMGAACIVSAGYSMTKGAGATMTVSPIVPDWKTYPEWGRDINATVGEMGLAGHWIKLFLHYMFLHKAKGYPFWWLLPE